MRIAPVLAVAPALLAQGLQPALPLQRSLPLPPLLDLSEADVRALLPLDPRDPAQVEACRKRWETLAVPFAGLDAVRIRLGHGEDRARLLLAASQALKARTPGQKLLLAHEAGGVSLWDPAAWGALDGGALAPEDLGPDPATWRARLAQAQERMPGRPWILWPGSDPGPLAGVLLGDGGRLVAPAGGPLAALAQALPPGFAEVEGGQGDLGFRDADGRRLRWRFEAGAWRPAPLPKERTEVAVTAKAAYDVQGLLARMRATQLRDRAALHSLEAQLDVDLHIQGRQGPGVDLGFRFRSFERNGEPEELLQQEVRFNGVRAKLAEGLQLPLVEARAGIAVPVALGLTERYRYTDGGPGQAGTRLLRFAPVDADPLLYEGELTVDEASGRVLRETSFRSGLPGTVKSERRVLRYGEVGPGLWHVVEVRAHERWVTASGVTQVQRDFTYTAFRPNAPDFGAARERARGSRATMLRQTPEGVRYLARQKDGSRAVETRLKSSGRGIGGVLVVDPSASIPVFPAAGLAYFDSNAFDKGVQVSALTAVVFTQASLAAPRALGALDLGMRTRMLLLPVDERPIRNGRLADREAVARQEGALAASLGGDLGAGFRAELEGEATYTRFSTARDKDLRTPGFALPPSGAALFLQASLGWQGRGLRLDAFGGRGRRPDGAYGSSATPQAIPDEGRFSAWGGAAGYDLELGRGFWLRAGLGFEAGGGFDRFKALEVGGLGGAARVPGIRSNAIAADRLGYGELSCVVPTGPRLRLTARLDHARARSLDDRKTYGFTGLGLAGDLPGFWCFTTVRVDLGVGLQSDLPGLRQVNGWVALLRVF